MVVPLTGLIGGLPAGMAALTGNMIRKAWKKPGDAVDNTTGASLAAQPTGPAVLNTEAAEALSGLNPPSQTAESRTGGQPSSRGTDSTASADHHKETGRETDPANPAESDSTHERILIQKITSMHNVVLISGDGIGPEITSAVQQILTAAGAPVNWIPARAGMGAYKELGNPLPEETVRLIDEHKVALKGPLENAGRGRIPLDQCNPASAV